MKFVQRDVGGAIVGVYANAQAGYAEEGLADNDPEVLAFFSPPPGIPQSVSPLQARRALRQVGLVDQVNASVAAAEAAHPGITDAWQYASAIQRSDPFVALLAPQLNLTPAALDNLFTLAASL